jgi:[ribosomal protein S5]-alanine N-acetyltransferase
MLSLQFSPFPALETERLLLQQITPGDAAALFEMRSDKDIMKYIDRPLAQTVDDALALIQVITDALQKNEGITWGIYLKEGSPLLGTLGFWRILKEHYRAEIGYLLHPSLQGKGLMQEAVRKVLHHGFANMQLHSVEANVNPANAASIRLLEKTGFVREAHFRENYFYNGRFLDSYIYSLLAPNEAVQPAAK